MMSDKSTTRRIYGDYNERGIWKREKVLSWTGYLGPLKCLIQPACYNRSDNRMPALKKMKIT